MKPTISNRKISLKLIIIYIVILLVCVIGIAIALSKVNYFAEEKIGLALGIVDEEAEKEDEYNELKLDFDNIFTNQLETIGQQEAEINKIDSNYDLVVTAYKCKEEKENCTIDVEIPYINVAHSSAKEFNKSVSTKYKQKAETLKQQISSMNIIYTVQYNAYLQNNILSLIIRSEYKEGEKSQKITIDTFNYNVVEQREVKIEELLKIKNIKNTEATEKIRKEIKDIQEQNQALIDEGYAIYQRDYSSEKYDVLNSQQFLYGKNGMLYIIYPYGNDDNTSEIDTVIFK